MPRLVVHELGGVTSAVALDEMLEIGRERHPSTSETLVLGDSKVSRHHATIRREGSAWIISDAESRHGTFVNGDRVTRHVLRDGDQIQVGSTRLVFGNVEQRSGVALQIATTDLGPMTWDAVRGAPGGPLANGAVDPRLRVFYQLAEATAAIDEADGVLRRALAAIVAVLGCERGVIALGGTPQTLRRAAEVQARDCVIGRVVIDAVVVRGEALLLGDTELSAATLDRQGVRSAMAAPLRLRDRMLGMVYVDDRGRADAFAREDLELLIAVARLAAVIVDVALRYERAVALVEVARSERVAPELIGNSDGVQQVRREVERFGATELPVHLTGESGVGKELVARALHQASPRSGASFVAINCAAMPDTLLESELFGHVRGAFTGADKARRGKLALADHGTLFLDEVVDLSPAAQAKLLRVLEDGEVTPVGAETTIRIDVRLVSASHKDLCDAVAKGTFRQDLYYRIAGAEIAIPPLRSRGNDVLVLAEIFVARLRQKRPGPTRLSAGAAGALAAYGWPGNVRELRHAIERACAIASGDVIEEADLALRGGLMTGTATSGIATTGTATSGTATSGTATTGIATSGTATTGTATTGTTTSGTATSGTATSGAATSGTATSGTATTAANGTATSGTESLEQRFAALDAIERGLVEEAMARANGNVSEAARLLGISRVMMKRRLDRFSNQDE